MKNSKVAWIIGGAVYVCSMALPAFGSSARILINCDTQCKAFLDGKDLGNIKGVKIVDVQAGQHIVSALVNGRLWKKILDVSDGNQAVADVSPEPQNSTTAKRSSSRNSKMTQSHHERRVVIRGSSEQWAGKRFYYLAEKPGSSKCFQTETEAATIEFRPSDPPTAFVQYSNYEDASESAIDSEDCRHLFNEDLRLVHTQMALADLRYMVSPDGKSVTISAPLIGCARCRNIKVESNLNIVVHRLTDSEIQADFSTPFRGSFRLRLQ